MNSTKQDKNTTHAFAVAIRVPQHCLLELDLKAADAFGIRHGELMIIQLTLDGILIKREAGK